jgi:Protein of unknown function (DUF548).
MTVAVVAETDELLPQAVRLAQQLDLPLVSPNASDYPYLLCVTPLRLLLKNTQTKPAHRASVDFLSPKLDHRRKNHSRELLCKALGRLDPATACIVDATAGFGEDAFLLACQGYRLILLERSKVIGALLTDGLSRFYASPDPKNASIQLQCILQDAKIYLPQLASHTAIDVVYLDPMFPLRKKLALPRKEMSILRDLVGGEDEKDADDLLQVALSVARYRVVVKRQRLAAPLSGMTPTFSLRGKMSRFDVYVCS